MATDETEFLPVLRRGKHRTGRRGACFMEMASVLAGERFTDHPACTHPLLAHLARLVNDYTSDRSRQRLARHVPSVIGLRSADPRWDHEIALLAATTAMPYASPRRRPMLALGILACDRLLARHERRAPGTLRPESEAALAADPASAAWARRTGTDRLLGHPGPGILECAVPAIARARGVDSDALLHDLLLDAIALCRRLDEETTQAHRETVVLEALELAPARYREGAPAAYRATAPTR